MDCSEILRPMLATLFLFRLVPSAMLPGAEMGVGTEEWKKEIGNGVWVKGKASALWGHAVPGLRPGMFSQGCFPRGSYPLILILAVAGIVEKAGGKVCSALFQRESADLCRPSA